MTHLVNEQIFARLVGFEDFEDVFGVIGARIVIADARQVGIAVTVVHLIGHHGPRRCRRPRRPRLRTVHAVLTSHLTAKNRNPMVFVRIHSFIKLITLISAKFSH